VAVIDYWFYEGAFGDARTPVPASVGTRALAAPVGGAVVDVIAHLGAADRPTVEGAVRRASG
jgi:hypothetical protein